MKVLPRDVWGIGYPDKVSKYKVLYVNQSDGIVYLMNLDTRQEFDGYPLHLFNNEWKLIKRPQFETKLGRILYK